MKVEDNIISYEISKQLPKSTQNEMEVAKGKRLSDEQIAKEKDAPGQNSIVNLSPAIKETQTIKEIISSEPDIREEKVAELKERIESGRYEIDNDAVADKLVDAFIDDIS
jgi:negative regulator of flagellin synthesis FlgM